jgi:CBS domain-containing protein
VDEYLDSHFTVEQLMHAPVATIPSNSTVRDAARALSSGKLHAVPVVRGDDELVGIVTTTDIVSFVASQR